jgi:hypothetical protein
MRSINTTYHTSITSNGVLKNKKDITKYFLGRLDKLETFREF